MCFIPVVPVLIKSNDDFNIDKLRDYNGDIVKFISYGGTRVVTTSSKWIYVNGVKEINTNLTNIAITPQQNKVMCCGLEMKDEEGGSLKIWDVIQDEEVPCNVSANDIMSCNGRVYVKQEDKLTEICFMELPNKILAHPKVVANIQENASKLFEGVVIQNVLGSCVASVLPESGVCHQILLPEMKGYQIIDAKYDGNVLIIVANKKGKYDKFIFTLSEDFSKYETRKVDDIIYSGINFTVLPNGIVILVNENEEIEIFVNQLGKNKIKVIDSSSIKGDMRLFSDGAKVLFSEKDELYQIKMKKNS